MTKNSDLTPSKDTFYIPLNSIQVQPYFNCRQNFGDIPSLAKDIASNGLTQPLIVRRNKENTAYIIDDGERRFRAINYINTNKLLEDPILDVKCILEIPGTNEENRLLKMFSTGANSLPLSEIEQAEIVYRLINFYHMSKKDTANRIGRLPQYIKHLLDLHSASLQVREAVQANKLSPTAATKLARASKETQDKILSKSGKVKVKDVEKATTPFMISTKSIQKKIETIKTTFLTKEQNPTIWKDIIKGLELALGLWELKEENHAL